MTPLRQRMTEDMQLRNLSAGTQRASLHYITGLARFYQTSPEHLSLEELREYQLYMINERQYSPESVNHFVAAAKFLYNVTLETPWPEGALPRCPTNFRWSSARPKWTSSSSMSRPFAIAPR
jgi:integrase/recombinase XerD